MLFRLRRDGGVLKFTFNCLASSKYKLTSFRISILEYYMEQNFAGFRTVPVNRQETQAHSFSLCPKDMAAGDHDSILRYIVFHS